MPLRRAFTIIELLVVISIITMLIALLMPALRHVRSQARITMCRSNLLQINAAVHGYINDFDMNEPWRFANGSADYPHESGHTDTRPGTPANALVERTDQLPDGRVFFCPDVPVTYEEIYHPLPDHAGVPRYTYFHGTYAWHWKKIRRAESNIQAGNGIIYANPNTTDLVMIDAAAGSWFAWGFPYRREHYNALFIDGHVEQVGGEDFDIHFYLWGEDRRPYN